jgi:hypothetical protein
MPGTIPVLPPWNGVEDVDGVVREAVAGLGPRRDDVVEPYDLFAAVRLVGAGLRMVAAGPGEVRFGIGREQRPAVRRKSRGGNRAIGERLAGERIARRGERGAAKIAIPLAQRRHRAHLRHALMVLLPVLAEEEEHLRSIRVEAAEGNRPANRIARIVERERCGVSSVEERPRVEFVVAHELVRAAMELPRATFGDDVDERAGATAELRAVTRRQHLDFGNRVEAWLGDGIGVRAVVHVVGAVDHEVRGRGSDAVDRLSRRGQSQRERVGRLDHGAREELEELGVVAAVQRDVVHLFAGDHAADVARLGLDVARQRRDRDGLADVADLELEVDSPARRRVEDDVDPLDRLEAGDRDPNRVGARGQAGEDVPALTIGHGRLREPGLRARGRDAGARHRRAGRVNDPAGNLADIGLSRGCPGGEQDGRDQLANERAPTCHGETSRRQACT